jgi:hypothetical protein
MKIIRKFVRFTLEHLLAFSESMFVQWSHGFLYSVKYYALKLRCLFTGGQPAGTKVSKPITTLTWRKTMVSPLSGDTWNIPDAQPRNPNGAPASRRAVRKARTHRGLRVGGALRALRLRLTRTSAEAVLLVLVLALTVVVAGSAIGERVLRPHSSPVISVTVQPGDTLWTLASRYGYPQDYILKRVDHLAAYNHLPAGAHLQPGQVIQVPVENPAEQQRILVSNGAAQ